MVSGYQNALPAGSRLESYEITEVLGRGGFGITYRAYDHSLQCHMAIKEYMPAGLAERDDDGTTLVPRSEAEAQGYEYGLSRFLDEARTLARFREPSIVRVNRYIEAHGTAYFVMDYVEGRSLAEELASHRPLSEDRVRCIAVPILHGLRAVHREAFLHRDIKPGNILIRNDGYPILLDFGSARQHLEQQTQALTAMVTPGFAPFEQYHTRDRQGPYSDLYALGATLYACLLGHAPVAATERVAALQGQDSDPVRLELEGLADRCEREFVRTLGWMLMPLPAQRPQTADEVLRALGVPLDGQTRELGAAAEGATSGDTGPSGDLFPKTVSLDEEAPVETGIAAETLAVVEAALADHIGPLSGPLVRKAARRSAGVESLVRELAEEIPTSEERRTFLDRTRGVASSAATRQADTGEVGRAPSERPTRVATAPPLTESARLALEALLADYMGPIARVLVGRAVRDGAARDELGRRLAAEIEDPGAQTEFRARFDKEVR